MLILATMDVDWRLALMKLCFLSGGKIVCADSANLTNMCAIMTNILYDISRICMSNYE